uniref:Uncharacterized protein n=1 Tax=Tanacetum cinerariifolium TaxID=118510 RepID=A0A699K4G1_TANCI|nr:hypothetical protein [Tanacetum cinerariifolium]
MKKKQQVELDEAYSIKLQEELNQDIDWEAAMDHIVPDEDDDVFIEATPLARKVPVVDYQILTHEVYTGTTVKCSKTSSERKE